MERKKISQLCGAGRGVVDEMERKKILQLCGAVRRVVDGMTYAIRTYAPPDEEVVTGLENLESLLVKLREEKREMKKELWLRDPSNRGCRPPWEGW